MNLLYNYDKQLDRDKLLVIKLKSQRSKHMFVSLVTDDIKTTIYIINTPCLSSPQNVDHDSLTIITFALPREISFGTNN